MITNIKLIQSLYDATWGRWVFAGAYDRFLKSAEAAGLSDERKRIFSAAQGRTLEVATGTGLNLPYFGSGVSELILTEPYPHMVKILRDKVKLSGRRAAVLEATAEDIPFPDESFDTVAASMILCTADDPDRVLREIHRVLKKGGQYLFLEHVRNPDPAVAKRQDRVQPAWYLFGNGCHCNRDTIDTLNRSPLQVEHLNHGRIPKAWSIVEAMVTGRAIRPVQAKQVDPFVSPPAKTCATGGGADCC